MKWVSNFFGNFLLLGLGVGPTSPCEWPVNTLIELTLYIWLNNMIRRECQSNFQFILGIHKAWCFCAWKSNINCVETFQLHISCLKYKLIQNVNIWIESFLSNERMTLKFMNQLKDMFEVDFFNEFCESDVFFFFFWIKKYRKVIGSRLKLFYWKNVLLKTSLKKCILKNITQ